MPLTLSKWCTPSNLQLQTDFFMLFLRIKPRTKKGELKSWNLQFFCLSVASIQQPMNNGFDVKVALNAYTDSIEIVVDSIALSKALKSWCWKRWTQSQNNANQGSLELFEILSSAFHKRVVCLPFFLNSFCSYLLDENLNKKKFPWFGISKTLDLI